MSTAASRQLRQTMYRLLLVQCLLAIVLALLAAGKTQSMQVAAAVLFGGAVAMAGTLVILWYGYRAGRAGASLGRNATLIFGSAIVRFVVMMTLLATGIAILRLQPLWLLAGLSACLLLQAVLTVLVPGRKNGE